MGQAKFDWGPILEKARGAIAEGHSLKAVAKALGIPRTTLREALERENGIGRRPPEPLAFEEYEENTEELWKEQRAVILAENARLRARNKQLRALNEIVIQAVDESIARIPGFPPPLESQHGDRSAESANLLLSDMHGGELVRPEDVSNLEQFNWDILLARMDTLREGVLSISDIERRARPINILNMHVLGDMVTNEDIYVGQGRDIDRILVDQVFEGAEALVQKLLIPFCKEFSLVKWKGVYGNHGRLGTPKGTKHRRSNADYILQHVIRLRLQNIENFQIDISTSPFMGFSLPEAPNFNHLIVHGDGIRAYMGLPYYGAERYVRRMISATSVVWDYVYLGHFHQKAEIDLNHGETIFNGSWVGATEHSVVDLQSAAQPKQLLFGLHPEWGITWRYDLKLAPRPKLVANQEGLFTPVYRDALD